MSFVFKTIIDLHFNIINNEKKGRLMKKAFGVGTYKKNLYISTIIFYPFMNSTFR